MVVSFSIDLEPAFFVITVLFLTFLLYHLAFSAFFVAYNNENRGPTAAVKFFFRMLFGSFIFNMSGVFQRETDADATLIMLLSFLLSVGTTYFFWPF